MNDADRLSSTRSSCGCGSDVTYTSRQAVGGAAAVEGLGIELTVAIVTFPLRGSLYKDKMPASGMCSHAGRWLSSYSSS